MNYRAGATVAAGVMAMVIAVGDNPVVSADASPPAISRMDAATKAAANLASTKVQPLRSDGDGRVLVYVDGDGDIETIRKAVTANGGEVSDEDTTKVRAAVPPSKLEKLAGTKGVKEIRRPDEPVEMAIISEGVQSSGASAWHGNGKLGAGVKVGIIDVGFGRLDEAQANGELPADIPVYNGQCPAEHGSSHGTTMAEVVHDMAPQSQLLFACVADSMGFDDAARWLKDQGAQVVNISIAFPGTGRGDGHAGTGPASTVAWLRSNGIVVVAAAGNEGLRHMTGPTADPENNGWMNVSGASESLGFSAGNGSAVTVELKWDAWPVTNEDLDLYIMSAAHKPSGLNDPDLVAYSTRPQKATPGGMTPVEIATFSATPLTYWVYVKTNGAQPNLRYDLTTYGETTGLSYTEPAGSIAEPATSPYAIAVGAITPANAAVGTVESYSSRGPTIDGRIKPDVTGFTNVSTYTGGPAKAGTSIAAAHVTGAAALYKSANLNLDPAQLEAALLDSSTRPGRDNTMGHGVLNVGPPQTPQPSASAAYTALAASRRVLDATLKPSETLTLRIPDLPADTTAVALNVNGLSATAQTDIEVFADLPTGAATLPMIPQSGRSVMVMATLHPRDKVVRIRNEAGDTHVVVDLVGYFANAGSTYFPVQRAIRLNQPAPTLAAGEANARTLQVRGVSGIPTNATAVAVTVTTTAATDATHIRLYARNWPSTWVYGTASGESLTYTYVVPIGDDGAIRIGNEVGTVDTTVDVTGWFGAGSGARYVPLRYTTTALSTATGTSTAKKAFEAKETREIRLAGWPRIPYNATGVAMALSAPRADSRSQVASWPQEYGWSGASALSVEAAEVTCSPEPGWAPATNAVITPLGPSGVVKLRNYSSSVDTAVSVSGYFVGGSQAAAPPAAPTPSSHWKFDEGTGTTVSDSAGAHPATMRLNASWQDGVSGKAGRFDGVRGDAVTAGPALRTDQSFTVSVWAYLTNRNGAFLMGQDGDRASGFYLEYLDNVNGGDRWSFSALAEDKDGAPALRAQGPRYPAVDSWTHIVGVYDEPAHQMRLYVNGVLAGVQGGVTLWHANGPFTIGSAKYNNGRAFFPGGVDDVRVYQTALTDSATRDLYASYQSLPAVSMPPTGNPPRWYGWDSLDGKITGIPAVARTREGRIDLFANGTDNKLYHRVYDGSWSPWVSIGDSLASDPAAVSWGPGRFDLFARGPGDELYHKAYDGQWHEWRPIGGKFKYAPAVSSWGPGRLDVFAVEEDENPNDSDSLFHKVFDGGRWYEWENLGGGLTASPAAIAWGGPRVDVFVRGEDNALYQMAWDNVRGWYPWYYLGGKLNSGPTVASWGPGRLDIFAIGTDDAVHHIAWDRDWYGWYRIGGHMMSATAAVSWGWPRIDLFGKGSGDTLCHKAYG